MIVLLATVVVVCGGIVVVAVGRGGQIAEFTQDAPPLELPSRRPIAGTDVALLRLPTGPWGYSYRATDDALRRIAHALTERDTRIAVLEQQVSELRSALPSAGRTGGDSGSPWFDRAASFEDRRRPVSSRTGEAAAIGAAPIDTPEEPAAEPEDAPAQDDLPGDAGRTDQAAADVDPEHDTPEPGGTAGPAWVRQKAWTPGAAWTENGSGPKSGEPADAGSEPETAEADEDWAFDDDAEPTGKPTANALGFSAPAPWPGDRLVATSRPRTETGAGESGEKAAAEDADEKTGTAEDDEDTAESKADEIEDDAAATPVDKPDDETADGEPHGEGH